MSMPQTFEEWLKENRRRDENVIAGEKIIERIRQELMEKLVEHFDDTKDETWCKCDTCTLIRLTREEGRKSGGSFSFLDSLAYVGLEYLLGENFNAVAALYYYSYVKELNEDELSKS